MSKTVGKTGRPPQRDEAKRAAIAVRTTPTTKARLQEAADRAGRSLTQEIEQRLEQSLKDEDALGSLDNLAFFRAMASMMRLIESRTGNAWRQDTATWQAVRKMADKQFRNWRPYPPNSQEIEQAIRERDEAEAEANAKLIEYQEKYPSPWSPNNALAALCPPFQTPDKPEEGVDPTAIKRDWEGLAEAFAPVNAANAKLARLLEEVDASEAEGDQIADSLITAIEAIEKRAGG